MAPASLASVSDCSVSMKLNSAICPSPSSSASIKSTSTPQSPLRRESLSLASPDPALALTASSFRLLPASPVNGPIHAVVDVARLLEQRKADDRASDVAKPTLTRPGCLHMEASPALIGPADTPPMTLRDPSCSSVAGMMVAGGGDGVEGVPVSSEVVPRSDASGEPHPAKRLSHNDSANCRKLSASSMSLNHLGSQIVVNHTPALAVSCSTAAVKPTSGGNRRTLSLAKAGSVAEQRHPHINDKSADSTNPLNMTSRDKDCSVASSPSCTPSSRAVSICDDQNICFARFRFK